MTDRQPKGTPMGGQFAEGRNPEGTDLTPPEEANEQSDIQTESDAQNLSLLECAECGSAMDIDDNGVSHYLTKDGDVDYDADGEHVAYTTDDEEIERVALLNERDEEQPIVEEYCDYCEEEGHTFRSCPRRDDTPDQDVSDDFPMSVEYDTSYEDGD